MKIGYARVSTEDQHLDLQLSALTAAGCEKIYQEKISGAKTDRPELARLLEHIRQGDEVIVWKLDRLGRSLPHLVELVTRFADRGVAFTSLQEKIDTSSPSGKLIFHIFCSLAEFERELIRERTNAGIKAAREQGRVGGRPKGLSPAAEKTAKTAEALYRANHHIQEIARQLGKSKVTIYKYLRSRGIEFQEQ
ncbi:recombinase family protein [Arsenicibacter rosenii]|uniref:Resolvase n=1 Tax=Arsenicibacter rosenii TaxID=1750698 RepID=A0A1S2VPW5_9BACT|nr:recombinase family protein [Arsenicibacter rosenii]OIN59838.1 resolvase [Arsenicibacter rosenii]